MSRTCTASWLDDHSALMTSPQYDIARDSGVTDHCRYFLLRSPYTPCATAHPAKYFLLSQHGKISRTKRAKGWEVSEIFAPSYSISPSTEIFHWPQISNGKFRLNIEVLYNRKRLHSTLGYKSPIQFLDAWLIAQKKEKLVA